MECAAGLAAFTGLGAKTAFEYNRENFLYDRRLRFKKEMKILEFKIAQASLWREDVRDLVSLTEYKMHAYLLVNVLMLASTVTLWCEGRLPPETPDWLMMGSSLSITGAFMFLLLSMWLAMHAAVAAQSYEARLLTQLVRLPIPSWQEVEACRTYASEFERAEGKQMFRVPFVMGSQESLVREGGDRPSARASDSDAGDSDGADVSSPVRRSRRGLSVSFDEQPASASAADPWGYERRGDDISELGCYAGSEVAKLRHVKLTHQAMTYWQSYDAFARISLSLGTNQLLLALTYYMLGYILVETGCRTAATYGVILLIVLAEALAKLDMSLSIWQLRAIQFLLAYGPMMSCAAAYHWSLANFESVRFAEALVISSFAAHGILIGLIVLFCRVRPQNNGTLLPVAFRSVLYLDVFGWVKQGGHPDERRDRSSSFYRGSGTTSPQNSPRRRYVRQADFGDVEEEGNGRPALETIKFQGGRPVPRRPEDARPADAVQDLRGLHGAPEGCDTPARGGTDEFFGAPGWMPGCESGDDEDELASVVTGHESEMPRVLPWRLFCTLAVALGVAWILAGVYHFLGASETWDMDIPFEVEHKKNESWNLPSSDPEGDLQIGELRTIGRSPPGEERPLVTHGDARQRHFLEPSFLAVGARFIHGRSSDRVVRPEPVASSWPHPNVEPAGLSCDASGRHFAVTDGVSMYAAVLDERPLRADGPSVPEPTLAFAESECAALLGEGLQDTAVVCDRRDQGCTALALHRHGRRVAGCTFGNASADVPGVDLSSAWLERVRGAADTARGAHGRSELAVSLAAGAGCGGGHPEGGDPGAAALGCAVVGTSHGRVVELKRGRSKRAELLPESFLGDGLESYRGAQLGPGAVRAVGARHVGVLRREESGRQNIELYDRRLGGAPVGRLPLPVWVGSAEAFCAGGGSVYLLGEGVQPRMWRIEIPAELLAA